MPATANLLPIETAQPYRRERAPESNREESEPTAFSDTLQAVEANNPREQEPPAAAKDTDIEGGIAVDPASRQEITKSTAKAPGDAANASSATNANGAESTAVPANADEANSTEGATTTTENATDSAKSSDQNVIQPFLLASGAANTAAGASPAAGSTTPQQALAGQQALATTGPVEQKLATQNPSPGSTAKAVGQNPQQQMALNSQQSAGVPVAAVPVADSSDLPAPELARIDLAAKKAASTATGASAAAKSASQLNTGLASLLSGDKTPGTQSIAGPGLQTADTATPITLSPRGQQAMPLQFTPEVTAGTTQTSAEPTATLPAGANTPIASGQSTGASQPISFAQQLAQSAAQPPAQQLGISIARGAREGLDRIEIQLHPAELGRVDVRMELGHDGRIMAVVSAERSDTLDQLRRDIHQLERALADAGFNTDDSSFRFEDGQNDTAGNSNGAGGNETISDDETDMATVPSAAARTLHFDGIRVDISV